MGGVLVLPCRAQSRVLIVPAASSFGIGFVRSANPSRDFGLIHHHRTSMIGVYVSFPGGDIPLSPFRFRWPMEIEKEADHTGLIMFVIGLILYVLFLAGMCDAVSPPQGSPEWFDSPPNTKPLR